MRLQVHIALFRAVFVGVYMSPQGKFLGEEPYNYQRSSQAVTMVDLGARAKYHL